MLRACGLGVCDPVLRAGRDQHGGQPGTDRQGHDVSLHLLSRLFDISLAYGVGMMLALTRQRPRTEVVLINAAGVIARVRLKVRPAQVAYNLK